MNAEKPRQFFKPRLESKIEKFSVIKLAPAKAIEVRGKSVAFKSGKAAVPLYRGKDVTYKSSYNVEPLLVDPLTIQTAVEVQGQVPINRINEFLICAPHQVVAKGKELMGWLDERPLHARQRAFELLYEKLREWKTEHERNYLAALELLVTAGYPGVWLLLMERLAVRPVGNSHLYLVSMPRRRPDQQGPVRYELGLHVKAVLDDIMGASVPGTHALVPRLAVEVFRTLAEVDPNQATGPICQHLFKLTGLEQTAVLQAVAAATAVLEPGAGEKQELIQVVHERWRQLLSIADPSEVDNFPGVMARLVEIAGLCGEDVSLILRDAEGHPMRTWILHQLVRRPIEFMSPQRRGELYSHLLQTLLAERQARSFVEVLDIATRDPSAFEFSSAMNKLVKHGAVDGDP